MATTRPSAWLAKTEPGGGRLLGAGRVRQLLAPLLAFALCTGAGAILGAIPAVAVTSASLYVSVGGTGDCSSVANACGSLATAIASATGGAYATDAVTIEVEAGTYTDPGVATSYGEYAEVVNAGGLGSLTVQGTGGNATVSPSSAGTGVFYIQSGTVTLTNLVISGGATAPGASSPGDSNGGDGGGIYNWGTLTLTNDTVSGNSTGPGLSGFEAGDGGDGGGIFNAVTGTLTLTNDTVSGNSTGPGGNSNSAGATGGSPGGTGGDGGGIYNTGSLALSDDVISGNSTGAGGAGASLLSGGTGGDGGGIYNAIPGALTFGSGTVSDNRTGGGGAGGGTGTANPDNGRGAYGGSGGDGGGIYNAGTGATLTNVIVSGNATGAGGPGGAGSASLPGGGGGNGGDGAGIYNYSTGTLTLATGTLSGNNTGAGGTGGSGSDGSPGGNGGNGGAAYNGGSLTLTNDEVSGNSTGTGGTGSSGLTSTIGGPGGNGGNGGGVDNVGGLSLTDGTVSGNTTGAGGPGGASGQGCPGANGGNGGNGGGISNTYVSTLTESTIAANTTGAGGAATNANSGNTVVISGSTISVRPDATTNGALYGGNGGNGGSGGGIYNSGAGTAVTATYGTVSGNTTGPGSPGGTGANGGGNGANGTAGTGVAIYPGQTGTVVLTASIVAGSPPANCAIPVVDGDYNIEDGGTCGFGSADDSVSSSAGLDASLGPLQLNAPGLTDTIALSLSPQSPAIGLVPTTATALCPRTDQRGVTSAAGAPCDAGAYQTTMATTVATPTLTTTPSASSVTLGTTASTLNDTAVLAGGNHPTGTVTFTLYEGSTLVDTEAAKVSGDGTYTTPVGYTLPVTGTVTGAYQWDASYSGDAGNNPVTDDNAANEQVTVAPASPSLATTPSATAVALGTTTPTIKDTATISGGYNPTGSVTFSLSSNGSGASVYKTTVTVNGDGTYTTPGYKLPSTTVQAAGMYQWDASYSGDANNSAVPETNNWAEVVTVTVANQVATAYGWYTPTVAVGQTTFGFAVAQVEKAGYSGELNVVVPGKWWYEANVTSFRLSTNEAVLAGSGTLYAWSASADKGNGGWQLKASGVSYSATAKTNAAPGAFGITINDTSVSGLPNSSPVALTKGVITLT